MQVREGYFRRFVQKKVREAAAELMSAAEPRGKKGPPIGQDDCFRWACRRAYEVLHLT